MPRKSLAIIIISATAIAVIILLAYFWLLSNKAPDQAPNLHPPEASSATALQSNIATDNFNNPNQNNTPALPEVSLEKQILTVEEYQTETGNFEVIIENKTTGKIEVINTQGQSLEELIKGREDAENINVQPDFIYELNDVPNDPHFNLLYYLRNIGQSINGSAGTAGADMKVIEAWELTGSKEVVVAVIDSGVEWQHEDLTNRMWNGTNCKTDTGAVLGGCQGGYDVRNDNKNPTPTTSGCSGCDHGTHVAGIIGAQINNNLGVAGTGKNVKIMAIKADSINEELKPVFFSSDIIKGINFARYNGADIVNMSLGSIQDTCEAALDTAVYNAIKNFPGVLTLAAGNDNTHVGTTKFQRFSSYGISTSCWQGLDNVISIGNSTNKDARSGSSNYGPAVHVFAPGANIYSTVMNNSYGYKTGTSMAAPNAAGVISLILSTKQISPLEIRNLLIETADEVSALDSVAGGRINAAKALRKILPPVNSAGNVVTANALIPGGSATPAPVDRATTAKWESSGQYRFMITNKTVSNNNMLVMMDDYCSVGGNTGLTSCGISYGSYWNYNGDGTRYNDWVTAINSNSGNVRKVLDKFYESLPDNFKSAIVSHPWDMRPKTNAGADGSSSSACYLTSASGQTVNTSNCTWTGKVSLLSYDEWQGASNIASTAYPNANSIGDRFNEVRFYSGNEQSSFPSTSNYIVSKRLTGPWLRSPVVDSNNNLWRINGSSSNSLTSGVANTTYAAVLPAMYIPKDSSFNTNCGGGTYDNPYRNCPPSPPSITTPVNLANSHLFHHTLSLAGSALDVDAKQSIVVYYVINDIPTLAANDNAWTEGIINGSAVASGVSDSNMSGGAWSVDNIDLSSFSDGSYYLHLASSDGFSYSNVLNIPFEYSSAHCDQPISCSPALCTPDSATPECHYSYTGECVEVNLPTGVYTVTLKGAGGGIGAGNNISGAGGLASGTLVIDDNNTHYLYVGGAGTGNPSSEPSGGGFNGGGDAKSTGGGGGGASDIRTDLTLESRIIVAAGGGGKGRDTTAAGGAGGGITGEAGKAFSVNYTAGQGANNSTGGKGGCRTNIGGLTCGWTGVLGCGGMAGISASSYGGGGGGGGYYGGGGGATYTDSSGGGGGSSYVGGVLNGKTLTGGGAAATEHGEIVITRALASVPTLTSPANFAESYQNTNSLDLVGTAVSEAVEQTITVHYVIDDNPNLAADDATWENSTLSGNTFAAGTPEGSGGQWSLTGIDISSLVDGETYYLHLKSNNGYDDSAVANIKFYIDRTPPTVQIDVFGGNLIADSTYSWTPTIVVGGDDEFSGFVNLKYVWLTGDGSNFTTMISGGNEIGLGSDGASTLSNCATALDIIDTPTYFDTFSIPDNGSFVLCARSLDLAGNLSTIATQALTLESDSVIYIPGFITLHQNGSAHSQHSNVYKLAEGDAVLFSGDIAGDASAPTNLKICLTFAHVDPNIYPICVEAGTGVFASQYTFPISSSSLPNDRDVFLSSAMIITDLDTGNTHAQAAYFTLFIIRDSDAIHLPPVPQNYITMIPNPVPEPTSKIDD